MKLKTLKRAPVFIASGVVALTCLAQLLRLDIFERLEWMTYDWRVKLAVNHSPAIATNLGFVSISEDTISDLNGGLAGPPYGLYWPRHIYGRVARELEEQGARAVAFDILFGEERRDHPPLMLQNGQEVDSDKYFAELIRKSGNVILAADQGVIPPPLFRTNALTLGDITADRDSDGVLRRALAFRTYRKWHPAIRAIESDPEYGVDLRKAQVSPDKIVLPRSEDKPITIPLTNGLIDLQDFVRDRVPAGMKRFDKPFTEDRVWHMGITLAAQQLKLDLTNAEVALDRGTITLRGPNGLTRVIPVDRQGYFYINWSLPINDPRKLLTQEPFEGLLAQYQMDHGESNKLADLRAGYWRNNVDWRGKLVVVGSVAVGNDLSDRGATPLEKDTFLVSKHWNVANSILTGQFIRRAPLPVELLCILLMGAVAAFLTLAFRSFVGTLWVLAASAVYVAASWYLYEQYRYWVPMALPLAGGAVVTHAILLTYVVVFEQAERRRLRSVFIKMVPSEVVADLEQHPTEELSLSGARRNVTVLFADIRGFTEMTDVNRDKAAEHIKKYNLTGGAAEAVFEEQARETLATVNLYLAVMAEAVLKHKGAVDKFIGDCVMAFWGAPIPYDKHALDCVRAAIDLQRAVYRLNQERRVENARREAENAKLAAADQPLLELLPILSVGSGINTGVVTAGYMGADERLNYTVFGRDVNLASRLESVSGHGRIIISEGTLAEIIQDDSTLALSCVQLPPVQVKGIRTAVTIYEVPWREADPAAPEASAASPAAPREQGAA